MLHVEDWAEIRRLHRAERLPIKVIARVLGISKNTVKAALAADGPPAYRRTGAGSIVDGVEPRIRELLQAYPDDAGDGDRGADRVGPGDDGADGARVAELRPVYLPPDPASRTNYVAGEIAQCDFWFPDIEVPVGFGQSRTAKPLPVLTMVTGYSRSASAVLVPTRCAEDLYAGWWQHIQGLGAVPRVLVWDGEGAVGRWRGGHQVLTKECQGFRGVLGSKVIICRPGDPEAKGLVERFHDYLERSFLPGRDFTSPADFNAQLQAWLARANTRQQRRVGLCAPADRIAADRAGDARAAAGGAGDRVAASVRLARDHYVRLDSNDYSVHPAVIGRRIEVRADLHRVRVFCEGKVVADHERAWAKHQTLSDPVHVAAAKALRHERIVLIRPRLEPVVQVRCLADYDTALGVDGGVA